MKSGSINLLNLIWKLLLLYFAALPVCLPVQAKSLPGLKAAYVYNIAKFTRWPETSLAKNMRQFKLCLYGSGEVIDELRELNGRPISTHMLSIVEPRSEKEFKQCHALYISDSEMRRYRYVLSLIDTSTVLTVSDNERFIRQGGLVNLIQQDQKLRFQINEDLLENAELKMSSKLLKLAILVEGGK